jgi:hypothetical protein
MPVAAYARLVELCERERDLIAAAEWDAVVELGEERAALVAALPAKPPAAARSHVRRIQELTRANTAALAAARAATVAELGQLRTVRQTIRAYVGRSPAVYVDTRQ